MVYLANSYENLKWEVDSFFVKKLSKVLTVHCAMCIVHKQKLSKYKINDAIKCNFFLNHEVDKDENRVDQEMGLKWHYTCKLKIRRIVIIKPNYKKLPRFVLELIFDWIILYRTNERKNEQETQVLE